MPQWVEMKNVAWDRLGDWWLTGTVNVIDTRVLALIQTLLSGCSQVAVPTKGSACSFKVHAESLLIPAHLWCVHVKLWLSWPPVLAIPCYQHSLYQLLSTISVFDSSTVLCRRTCLPWPVRICTDILPGDVLMSYYRHPKLHTDKEHMLTLSENVPFWMLVRGEIRFLPENYQCYALYIAILIPFLH